MQENRSFALSCLLAALGCGAMLLSWSAPAFATPGQIHEVKRPEVNLRAGPGTGARVVGKLEAGARVMEFARKGRWFKVKQMGRVGPEGWVYGALIAPEKLPEPEPAAPPRSAPPTADEGGPRYQEGSGDGARATLWDRGLLPWSVIVKRKDRHRKGKGHHGHGGDRDKDGARAPTVRPGLRNLGWPRRSGAANLGTF